MVKQLISLTELEMIPPKKDQPNEYLHIIQYYQSTVTSSESSSSLKMFFYSETNDASSHHLCFFALIHVACAGRGYPEAQNVVVDLQTT